MVNTEKRYTFLNLKRCVGKNERPYVGATMEAFVSTYDENLKTTENGKRVINFSAPLHNRGKYVEAMCGKHPAENEKNQAWVRVSLWDSDPERAGAATRFKNLMDKNKGKNVVLMVTGAMKVEESAGKDGSIYINTNLTADDFFVVRIMEKKNGDTPQNPMQPAQQADPARPTAPAQAAPRTQQAAPAPQADSGFTPINDGYSDDDLPF